LSDRSDPIVDVYVFHYANDPRLISYANSEAIILFIKMTFRNVIPNRFNVGF
jgi:hypothetical protein